MHMSTVKRNRNKHAHRQTDRRARRQVVKQRGCEDSHAMIIISESVTVMTQWIIGRSGGMGKGEMMG